MPRRPSANAFTLIELLTVIAIIGILSGIVIGVGRRASETGREARAKVELAVISTVLESYKRQHGDYPQTNNATVLLKSLVGKSDPIGAAMSGKVLLDLAMFTTGSSGDPLTDFSLSLVDPWGNAYRYVYYARTTTRLSSYLLYSVGSDALEVPPINLANQNESAPDNLDNLYANR